MPCMSHRCEQDRYAQGPDGYVFEDAFEQLSLDPLTEEERRAVFETVST